MKKKKTILQINVTDGGSTGNIMKNIHKYAKNKYNSFIYYGRGKNVKFYQKFETYFSVFLSRFLSLNNKGCYFSTLKLIKTIKEKKPDLIHLHNVHGYYLNYSIFFKYLKKLDIPIVWTLHDCSAYTGHCAYYSKIKCDKWQKECNNCQQKHEYPKNLFFDTSRIEFLEKKKLFTGFKNLNLVVPSKWLNEEVNKSFLKNYKVTTIHNAIDIKKFKPTDNLNLKKKYNLENMSIILGVANVWDSRKGLNYFIELSKILPKNYKIILIGLNKNQLKNLPRNILGFERTTSIDELISFYTLADVFFNPSIEETFSLVTLEALACGTPCLVFNSTATPELIKNNNGIVLNDYSIENILKNIKKICNSNLQKNCLSVSKNYSLDKYKKYVDLYDELLGD